MPAALPEGDLAPRDGALPAPALAARHRRPFGIYVHAPFCATRCGYCDFNTYTPAELDAPDAASAYLVAALGELRLARRVLGSWDVPVSTVFVGGGTPTLLNPVDLARLLRAIREEFGLLPNAEVSVEANPESVNAARLAGLRSAGFTRISFGMQSAVPHVLEVLERRHLPGRPEAAVAEARNAGFDSVNLDLIYGAPGESEADWRASLAAALGAGPDHLSAYALVVEEGTRLAARARRGEIAAPDDDVLAERYLVAEETLTAAGFEWYEVSNWAVTPEARCRHNLGYWRDGNWWGIGPGAHSHVGGVRWWNVRHPSAYAARVTAGTSPAVGREVLDAEQRRVERVLLGVRLSDGHPTADLTPAGQRAAARLVDEGLLEPSALAADRLVLTLHGRLLADTVVRRLLPE